MEDGRCEDPAESSSALELCGLKSSTEKTRQHDTHQVARCRIAAIIQVLSVVPPPFTAQVTHLNKIGIKGSKKLQKKDN